MKRCLVWLFLGAMAFAQRSTTNITANNQCAQIGVAANSSSTVTIQVSGTWTATLQPQVALAGRAATNTQVAPKGSTTLQGTITANGVFSGDAAGVELFQVCTTAYTSGTAVIDLTVTTGIATNLLGGGGTGAVSSVFGRTGAVTATSGDYTAAQVTNAVAKNASNVFTSGLQDFSAVTVELPEAAGFTPNVDSNIGYDLTANNWLVWGNGVANVNVVVPFSVTVADEHCVDWSVVGTVITVDDAGAQGTATCNPVTSVFGRTGVVAATSGDYTAAQVTNAVALNAGNVYTSAGTGDFSACTVANCLKIPVGAGLTSGANGAIAYDSTNGNTHIRANGADAIAGAFASAPSNGNVVSASVPGATLLADSGFLATNVVRKDAANSGTSAFTVDGSSATGANPFKTQSKAGATATAAGAYTYDSTTGLFHLATNAVDATAITAPARVSATAQTAAIGTTTLCTALQCPANPGHYEVHWEFTGGGTACSSVSAGSVAFNLTWTDENAVAHAAVALQMMAQTGAATTAMGGTFPFQTTLANEGASGTFSFSTNGTIIQYSTTYIACTTGTGTYSLRAEVTRMQ